MKFILIKLILMKVIFHFNEIAFDEIHLDEIYFKQIFKPSLTILSLAQLSPSLSQLFTFNLKFFHSKSCFHVDIVLKITTLKRYGLKSNLTLCTTSQGRMSAYSSFIEILLTISKINRLGYSVLSSPDILK